MSLSKRYAIIVAGGTGLRMGADIPKQFLPLCGLPILMRTLQNFNDFDPHIELILVLPADQKDYWKQMVLKYQFSIPHVVAEGGDTRFQSVKNGLNHVNGPAIVGIHDGVRPLVSHDTLNRCYHHAETLGNSVPVLEAFESVRQVKRGKSKALDRSTIMLVQTPQVFESDIIKKAYQQDFSPLFTDDASVLEAFGETIHLIAGNRENIKITTPSDMVIAEAYFKSGLFEKGSCD